MSPFSPPSVQISPSKAQYTSDENRNENLVSFSILIVINASIPPCKWKEKFRKKFTRRGFGCKKLREKIYKPITKIHSHGGHGGLLKLQSREVPKPWNLGT